MEHLGKPVPIVALAAVLMMWGCSAKAQSPSAAPASPAAAGTAQSQPAAQPSASATAMKPSDVVSGDILDEIALTRAAIQTRRQAIVTAAMDLTAPESEVFWPLYRDYRTDMAKVDDRLVDLIVIYSGNYNAMTDDVAIKLMNEYVDIERARLDVKDRYVRRFLTVLPAGKVARFFHVDLKLDRKIQAELSSEIPLTR